uniref:Ig-like domain-containing protein n=2 Tax=Oreochromis niloticus TaxID=8128 RepID=A0A669FC23_ORENI
MKIRLIIQVRERGRNPVLLLLSVCLSFSDIFNGSHLLSSYYRRSQISFQITNPFPKPTDNMLVTLCALITALTCVSGVTVLTQKPVLSVRKGETATMDCNLGTVTNYAAAWHKQIPGGSPQFVLYFYHSDSSPGYGSGFSSPKFTSTHQSTTDYRLIIKNVEEGDSAVYYCQTWDGSANSGVSR